MERIDRPWGTMWKLIHTKRLWVKLLNVKGRNSLQFHIDRNELIIGTGTIDVALHQYMDDKKVYHVVSKLRRCIAYIPRFKAHRIMRGKYIEIGFGKHVDERDICRIDDDYGRQAKLRESQL